MDAVRVSALRDRLAGTGWLEAVGGFAGELRHAVTRRGAGELLLVGTTGYEPWHLAAHLEDEAAWSDVPGWRPPCCGTGSRPPPRPIWRTGSAG